MYLQVQNAPFFKFLGMYLTCILVLRFFGSVSEHYPNVKERKKEINSKQVKVGVCVMHEQNRGRTSQTTIQSKVSSMNLPYLRLKTFYRAMREERSFL